MQCPSCSHTNPSGSKFCNECGSRLLTPPAVSDRDQTPGRAAPSTRVHALIPADFAARLETARAEKNMVGERRIVTMLFCDVQGSTAAASRLDPEDWAQIINEAFDYMIRPIYNYEGNVARLMGDGILAFFGAPVAHEDDPQRAILAGLAIIEGFTPYREKIREEWGLDLEVRVGINTGLVMVGAVGSDLQMEYTALGDAINIAARMEQTATPGTIQVAEDTYRRTAALFEWEPLGDIKVKGKDGTLHTYRPLRIMSTPGKARGIEGLDAPMVGRKTEMESLLALAARLEQGEGSVVFMIGEAGLGKSRLVRELKAAIETTESLRGRASGHLRWCEIASLSYETTQPYSIFQRLLRRVYGIQEEDTPAEIWEKFLPVLNEIPPDVSDRGRLFEALFAVHGQSSAGEPEGETFKRQLFDLMAGLVSGWTAQGPMIIVLDDLHWADPASIDLLVHLTPQLTAQPLMMICAMRPERRAPAWEVKDNLPIQAFNINLAPLDAATTDELVSHLLVVSDLPPRLRIRILEKTEGNPFFIEEVVRSLTDAGALAREEDGRLRWQARTGIEDLEIPGNLQSLLTARIDRLDSATRRTLQLASVIGRTFDFRVLERICSNAAVERSALDLHLVNLQSNEMVLEVTTGSDQVYMFRHALTQEAAYNTILHRQRREYHRMVAEAVEDVFAGRLDEIHPILARHFYEAQDPRALPYGLQAGDAAYRVYAIPEAMGHYSRALEYLRRTGFDPGEGKQSDPAAIKDLFLRRGRCLELSSSYQAAQENYNEMREWAQRRGDRSALLAALIAQSTALAVPSPVQDTKRAKELAGLAFQLAEEQADQEAEARIQWVRMLILMYGGDMPGSALYGERAVQLARAHGLTNLLAHALQDLGLVYMSIGEIRRADAVLAEARPLWEAAQNLPMLAENDANTVYVRTMSLDLEEAIRVSARSHQIGQFIENDWSLTNARVFVGLAHLARGEADILIGYSQEVIERARKVGHPGSILLLFQLSWLYKELGALDRSFEAAQEGLREAASFPPFLPLSQAMSAWHEARLGRFEQAQELLGQASGTVRRKTLLLIDLIVDYVSAEYCIREGSLLRAQEHVDVLFAKLSASEGDYFLPDGCYLQAVIAHHLGRQGEARVVLQKGLEALEGNRADLKAWKLYAAMGMETEARDASHSILESISDPELRSIFENRVLEEISRWS